MKITDIKCYVIEQITKAPRFRWREGLPGDTDGTPVGEKGYTAIIKVETDEGIVGMARVGRGKLIADLVQRRLKQFIGMNPLMTEQLWHQVWEIDRIEEFPMYALGLLDIACWDIKARKANLPLYQLLGGYEAHVPAYASTVTWNTMNEYEQHIKECIDEGFFAYKLHAWGDVTQDGELSHNLRRWVGDSADLMFDGSAGWDYVQALKFGRMLEEAGFLW
jgi:L-alanine-DL-glutamate epimerase-like enolase superfamily enzyme